MAFMLIPSSPLDHPCTLMGLHEVAFIERGPPREFIRVIRLVIPILGFSIISALDHSLLLQIKCVVS